MPLGGWKGLNIFTLPPAGSGNKLAVLPFRFVDDGKFYSMAALKYSFPKTRLHYQGKVTINVEGKWKNLIPNGTVAPALFILNDSNTKWPEKYEWKDYRW